MMMSNTISETELIIKSSELANTETNNTLHFFLSLFTAGLWIPIWMLIALNPEQE
jgi:hypothetical protein